MKIDTSAYTSACTPYLLSYPHRLIQSERIGFSLLHTHTHANTHTNAHAHPHTHTHTHTRSLYIYVTVQTYIVPHHKCATHIHRFKNKLVPHTPLSLISLMLQ